MSIAETIAGLPGDARISGFSIGATGSTVDELRAAFLTDAGPVYITTAEASRRYSRSPKWWARAAREIPGAHKDRHWRLPVQGCEEHLARLIRPRRKRGPWHPTRPEASHAMGGSR
jgi:hypothetical protein